MALPALWMLQRNDDSGDRAGRETTAATTVADPLSDPEHRRTAIERASDADSIFLGEGGRRSSSAVVDVGVPAREEGEVNRARASFSSAFASSGMCVGGPAPVGSTLTITNVNNNRSATCVVVDETERINPDPGVIVLERSTYLSIANAADAPVPVEIRR